MGAPPGAGAGGATPRPMRGAGAGGGAEGGEARVGGLVDAAEGALVEAAGALAGLAEEAGRGAGASQARAGELAEQCLRALAGHQQALRAARAALGPSIPYRRAAYAEAAEAEVSAQKLRCVAGALRRLEASLPGEDPEA